MMLDFKDSNEEDRCLTLLDLSSHAHRYELKASLETFKLILKGLQLELLEDWVFSLNESKEAPYHGAKHEALVACYVFMGAVCERVSWSDIRCLVIAASLHDFRHTGVRALVGGAPVTDDTENVALAVDGLRSLCKQHPKLLTAAEQQRVERLIWATRFPYLVSPVDPLEQLIRDADMCMPYAECATELFLGLKAELTAAGRAFTIDEFENGVVTFYTEVKNHTHSAWFGEYDLKHDLVQHALTLRDNLRNATCRSSTDVV